MKNSEKTVFKVIIAVLLCGALSAGGIYMFGKLFKDGDDAHNAPDNTVSKKKNIESFDRVTLHESGMRFVREFEIVCDGDKSRVEKYSFNYSTGEERRILETSVVLDTADVITKLNEIGVAKWDGFVGKHPRNVRDGIMFNFKATVNGGQTISANGSQNFPKNYSALTSWLRETLKD